MEEEEGRPWSGFSLVPLRSRRRDTGNNQTGLWCFYPRKQVRERASQSYCKAQEFREEPRRGSGKKCFVQKEGKSAG